MGTDKPELAIQVPVLQRCVPFQLIRGLPCSSGKPQFLTGMPLSAIGAPTSSEREQMMTADESEA